MDGHHPLTDEVSDATHSLLDFFSAPTPHFQEDQKRHDERYKRQQERKSEKQQGKDKQSPLQPSSSTSSISSLSSTASSQSVDDLQSSPTIKPSVSTDSFAGTRNARNQFDVQRYTLPPIDEDAIEWKADPGGDWQHNTQSHKTFQRHKFLEKQLQHRKDEYTDTEYISVWCGTYNVNAKKAPSTAHELRRWLLADTDITVTPHKDKATSSRKSTRKNEKSSNSKSNRNNNFADGDDDADNAGSSTSKANSVKNDGDVDVSSSDDEEAYHPGKRYPPADVYAVGFQEIVDLDAKNFFVDHNVCDEWQTVLQETLDIIPHIPYTCISKTHLVGLALFVFVRDGYLKDKVITDVRTTTVGVGLMGVGGNKGAVICRFNFYNSSLCFVNTHLAAHQKNVKARNSDYHSICKRAALLPPEIQQALNKVNGTSSLAHSDINVPPASDDIFSAVSSHFNVLKSRVNKIAKDLKDRHMEHGLDMTSKTHDIDIDGYGIFDHDQVFWIGDNNYRIDDLTLEEVYQMIERHDWQRLLSHDQLIQEKLKGNAFADFEEGVIDFAPTYKYVTGTNDYDRREGGKVRLPAYCDRVQWLGDRGVKQRYYRRAELTLSDHKPVMSLASTPINIEVEERKCKLVKELESMSAEQAWPSLALSTRIVELGDVEFDACILRQVVIKNTGRSVVEFEIRWRRHHTVDEHGESVTNSNDNIEPTNKLPSWLKVTPSTGVIPLNSTITLTLRVRVTRKSASHLNLMGDKSLLSLLLVKCIDGGYHSIGLRGHYQRTILGCSLQQLCKLNSLNTGIANTPAAEIRNMKLSSKHFVPSVLVTMIDYLRKNDIASQRDLLKPNNDVTNELSATSESATGNQLLADPYVKQVIQQLNYNQGIKLNAPKQQELYAVLRALRIFLLCLPTPLISRPPKQESHNQRMEIGSPLSDEHHRRQQRLRDLRYLSSEYDDFESDSDSDADTHLDVDTWCYACVMEMQTIQYKTLITVIQLLRHVIDKSSSNEKHKVSDNIAASMSPCLTFRPANASLTPTIKLKPSALLRHVLENDNYV